MAIKITNFPKIKFKEKLLIKFDIFRKRKNNEPLIRKSLSKINNFNDLKKKTTFCQFNLIKKILKKYNLEYYFLKYNLGIALKIYVRKIDIDLLCPVCKTEFKEIQDRTFILNTCKTCKNTKEGKEYLKNLKTQKTKKTSKEKYGVDNVMKLPETIEKMKKNNLKKYGVDNPSKKHLKNTDKLNKEFITKNFLDKNKVFKLKKFRQFFNCDQVTAHNYLKKFNINWNKNNYSQSEKEILQFIKNIVNTDIFENTKNIISPYELDIYIPERNLAIEFDGLFWHSEGLKNNFKDNIKYYHFMKTKLAEAKNINLLHIFENEWLDPIKQDIWKSIISYKLGIVKQRYFARKLILREVSKTEARLFLEENHIQGWTPAKINLGLHDNDKLISIMTFSKPRYNKNFQYELIRFTSLKYSSCVGCASRIFKYFIKKYNPNSIISYANRRWTSSLSNVYKALGLKFIQETEPNYYYFHISNPLKLYHRSQFQKYKLKDYPETKDFYSDSKTEFEIMSQAGYRRIFDSGQLVYHWRA